MAQVVEHLEALNSIPSTAKKKKKLNVKFSSSVRLAVF
jgi:hypothetical protein